MQIMKYYNQYIDKARHDLASDLFPNFIRDDLLQTLKQTWGAPGFSTLCNTIIVRHWGVTQLFMLIQLCKCSANTLWNIESAFKFSFLQTLTLAFCIRRHMSLNIKAHQHQETRESRRQLFLACSFQFSPISVCLDTVQCKQNCQQTLTSGVAMFHPGLKALEYFSL